MLDRLPAPTSAGTRDVKGSIKILFQKLVGPKVGIEYKYPQLAIAAVAADGQVTYESDLDKVRSRVQTADKIVLYIHGIIGDTRGMVASARTDWLKFASPVSDIGSHYDLWLTFDYENLHTPIEETARLLKQRLNAVGLGPQHGKTLHIVAHSMGGLVSRWLIEREGGQELVQQLIMLGTPNAGSPWPKVEDYALTALTLGINALTTVAWPASVVGALVEALEKVDVSLEQMQPGSDFLQALNASPDPGIPYTIIAGNISIIPAALVEQDGQGSLLGRLWARVKPTNWLHTVTAPIFFGQPNDIAVTVESIKHLPANRQPPVVKVESACDHITYFSTEAGLTLLAQNLHDEATV
jgi:pimeloyl-ACP methyl ester carboxylesterase